MSEFNLEDNISKTLSNEVLESGSNSDWEVNYKQRFNNL